MPEDQNYPNPDAEAPVNDAQGSPWAESEPSTEPAEPTVPAPESISEYQPPAPAPENEPAVAAAASSPWQASPGRSPANNTPEPAYEAPAEAPVPAPAPTPPKKSRKKWLLPAIIAGIIAVLAGGTVLAYTFWYQNPDKVLADAMAHMLSAETFEYKGEAGVKGGGSEMRLTFDGRGTSKATELNAKFKMAYSGQSFEVGGSAIVAEDNMVYAKVTDLDSLVKTFLGDYAATYYSPVIEKINGQWIRMEANDGDEDLKEATCQSEALMRISKDENIKREIQDLYKQNKIVSIKRELEAKEIGGVDSLGFELGIDKEAFKKFVDGLNNTGVKTELQKCDSDFTFDSSEFNLDDVKLENATTTVYVSRWSHQLTQLSVTATEDDATIDLRYEPVFDKSVTVEAPKDSMTIDEFVKELESIETGPIDLRQLDI